MSKKSGRFVVRMDPALHTRLRQESHLAEVLLNSLVIDRLGRPYGQTSSLDCALDEAFGSAVLGVVLFGSEVRGERRKSSDIDLLIVMASTTRIERSLYQTWDREIRNQVDELYSPHFVNLIAPSAPTSLWLEVALEGRVLRDDALNSIRRVLTSIRDQIASGTYQRKMSHGHPYWVRI